jgi:predicted metal-dependent peptidase
MPRKRNNSAADVAGRNFAEAVAFLRSHPMFAPLAGRTGIVREAHSACPPDGWVLVTSLGRLHVHPTRRADPAEWVYVLAHAFLHLGLGHFRPGRRDPEWNSACDLFIARFLADLKVGRTPEEFRDIELPGGSEESLYEQFCAEGIPKHWHNPGTAGSKHLDMIDTGTPPGGMADWQSCFAHGLTQAVTSAINVAAGRETHLRSYSEVLTPAQRARGWFISSYPLLGALVAGFDLVEDPTICQREDISIAAVNASSKEIFVNSTMKLNESECRFVVAHEILHVGLMHDRRCEGRDRYLWNVACDFVVNGWLVEMGIGTMPASGLLYDPGLKGLSAENVYDQIVTDMRRYRKLATLRGVRLGEMLGPFDWRETDDAQDLDEFYRRALAQGLEYHQAEGRGYLPAGLIEEIRALSQPPIPWDVKLAQWFDDYFEPLEKLRSYARPSRRQSATPDIARPRYAAKENATDGRTFGVVLDTSGSMDRALLAKALGAIASYSMARDVPAVRVVFCDAATYDQGYMPPEAIADRVKVRGRGGTVLQPAVDMLHQAPDFPKDGPLLIITDGLCDRLQVRRTHAFLIPRGRQLPFVPKGPVFRIS